MQVRGQNKSGRYIHGNPEKKQSIPRSNPAIIVQVRIIRKCRRSPMTFALMFDEMEAVGSGRGTLMITSDCTPEYRRCCNKTDLVNLSSQGLSIVTRA